MNPSLLSRRSFLGTVAGSTLALAAGASARPRTTGIEGDASVRGDARGAGRGAFAEPLFAPAWRDSEAFRGPDAVHVAEPFVAPAWREPDAARGPGRPRASRTWASPSGRRPSVTSFARGRATALASRQATSRWPATNRSPLNPRPSRPTSPSGMPCRCRSCAGACRRCWPAVRRMCWVPPAPEPSFQNALGVIGGGGGAWTRCRWSASLA